MVVYQLNLLYYNWQANYHDSAFYNQGRDDDMSRVISYSGSDEVQSGE